MDAPLKILMLEDNPSDAELVRREIKKNGIEFTYKVTDNKNGFIHALNEFAPDIILSDHRLPQFNSQEALKIAREIKPDVPFILVTGTVSEEFAVQIIKEGADDYILKDNLTRLPNAIKLALKQKESEAQKHQAEEELKQLNAELDTFVYKSSHDMKAPLASIIGLIDLAKKEKSVKNVKEYLALIDASAKRMDRTIQDLLTASRVKHQQLQIVSIDIEGLLNHILESFQNMEGFHKIRSIRKIKITKPFRSDELSIKTILENTISNAIKYHRLDERNTYVKIAIGEKEKNYIISIEDNGGGMEPEVQKRVFEMFYRGNEKSTGTGLGLYIVKNVVRKLGGTIEVESAVNKGTIFIITIPIPK